MREVIISQEEYKNLLESNIKLDMLIQVIYENSSLSWDNKFLTISNDRVSEILKTIDEFGYKSKLEALKKEKTKDE